jgi:hypothetical protein
LEISKHNEKRIIKLAYPKYTWTSSSVYNTEESNDRHQGILVVRPCQLTSGREKNPLHLQLLFT